MLATEPIGEIYKDNPHELGTIGFLSLQFQFVDGNERRSLMEADDFLQ